MEGKTRRKKGLWKPGNWARSENGFPLSSFTHITGFGMMGTHNAPLPFPVWISFHRNWSLNTSKFSKEGPYKNVTLGKYIRVQDSVRDNRTLNSEIFKGSSTDNKILNCNVHQQCFRLDITLHNKEIGQFILAYLNGYNLEWLSHKVIFYSEKTNDAPVTGMCLTNY